MLDRVVNSLHDGQLWTRKGEGAQAELLCQTHSQRACADRLRPFSRWSYSRHILSGQ